MKAAEIETGGIYTAKVSGKVVRVRVDAVRVVDRPRMNNYSGRLDYHSATIFDVTNLVTGRRITFRSAAKFRSKVDRVSITTLKVNDSIKELFKI